jgi:hypothetical protein
MRIKEAKAITGSLTRTSKMPGLSYSLPAWECKTGSKLRNIKNSVCASCYALKGNYTRYPAIKAAQYVRLEALKDQRWIAAMVAQVIRQKFFRWHDAGDIQSMEHLYKIFRVCELTPETSHWMPTREAQFLKQVKSEEVPKNLIIRMSSHMVDQAPVKFWPWTSTVTSGQDASCPAPNQGNSCGDCRQCWDRSTPNVSYGKH